MIKKVNMAYKYEISLDDNIGNVLGMIRGGDLACLKADLEVAWLKKGKVMASGGGEVNMSTNEGDDNLIGIGDFMVRSPIISNEIGIGRYVRPKPTAQRKQGSARKKGNIERDYGRKRRIGMECDAAIGSQARKKKSCDYLSLCKSFNL